MPKLNDDPVKQQVKIEYESTPAKSRELAERYNIKDATIRTWINRDKWVKLVAKQPKKKLETETKNETVKNDVSKPKKVATIQDKNNTPSTKGKREGLTEKEFLFCLYFSRDPNALQAYLKAFNSSFNTAHANAYKLMAKTSIRTEIDRLKAIKFQSIMLQPDDIVEMHMRIAFSNPDYIEFGRVEVPVMGPRGPVFIKKPNQETGKDDEIMLKKTVNEVRIKESFDVDMSVIKSISQGKDGIKIEGYDKQKSLDWLSGYFQINPMDKHKVEYDNARLQIERDKIKGGQFDGDNDKGVQIIDNIT